ncbi:MAG: family 43 glycosylhydrolase [Abditibacteriota bacterium]|nr:family 43 glycosylhydrolase [Abditibacteriota bacterium]
MNPKTYCNPLSIPDIPSGRWLDTGLINDDTADCADYRSVADPSVVYDQGRWILYPSYAVAWVSEDLLRWKRVDIGVPHLKYSPAVVKFRGRWYLTGNNVRELWVSDSPLGPFEICGEITDARGNVCPVCDPCFLAEGDRLYMYWTHSTPPENGEDVEAVTGTAGVEMDPDRPWRMLGDPVILNRFDPSVPWQRTGEYNENTRMGWVEGQWMTKLGDRYYLLYSGSGTEYGTYASGIAISDEGPLSGFRPQKRHDPLTRKTAGLVRGAGHGCLVEGPGGTLWTFYTCVFCFNHMFERRIGMDPVGMDEDGELFCPAVTETPQFAPGVLSRPEEGNGTGWLPFTFMQRPWATSRAPGRDPIYASDDSVLTWWQPAEGDPEPCITFPLGQSGRATRFWVRAVRLIWRDIGMDTLRGIPPGPFRYLVEYSPDRGLGTWQTLIDASENTEDLSVDYRETEPAPAYGVRLRILGAPAGITPGLVSLTAFGSAVKETVPNTI